jgi:segregation and condensation protein A
MQDQESYRVRLEVFEGPLDLLLYLIRKNEVDVYDIPIALIVEQYLGYLDLMRTLNLDVAGDFLVMAASLSHIKSQLLLPQEAVEAAEDEAGADPRAELVRKLLDYQRFKEAAEDLVGRPMLGRDVFTREEATGQIESAAQAAGISSVAFAEVGIFELLTALQEVLERGEGRGFHEVTLERISIMDRINQLLGLLRERESITFEQLFTEVSERSVIITTFLAMLELIRLKVIKVYQTEPFGAITLLRAVEINEGWLSDNLPQFERTVEEE